MNWEALWGGVPDAPEDVAELIRDDDCLAGKRKQDLCRFFGSSLSHFAQW